jgi:hypothetical protein
MCLALITTALSVNSVDAASGACSQWEPLFRKHGLPAKTFSKIAWRESRCNPKSISAVRKLTGRPDVGLLQIQGSWSTVTQQICNVSRKQVVRALTDASCNVRVARYLYDNGGLGHWRVTSGK